MKIFLIVLSIIIPNLFFCKFGKQEKKEGLPAENIAVSLTVKDSLNADTVPKFWFIEGKVDSENFDMYISENIVSDGSYFTGIAVTKTDGIPHPFVGSFYTEENIPIECDGFINEQKLIRLPRNSMAKKRFSMRLSEFGTDKKDIRLWGTIDKSGNFKGALRHPNTSFPTEQDSVATFEKQNTGYDIVPRLIVSKNSACGVYKKDWQDLMRFNFLEFQDTNFNNDRFLQTYCSEMKNSYKSYFYDYTNITDEELRKIDFGSTVYTYVSFIGKSYVSGFFENNYLDLEHGLRESVPYLYGIKEQRNLTLLDIVKSNKRDKVRAKILDSAKTTHGIGNCPVNTEDILNNRIFITFKGINLIFCSANRSNRGFQGLLVFVPFDQIKDYLTEDFRNTMKIL